MSDFIQLNLYTDYTSRRKELSVIEHAQEFVRRNGGDLDVHRLPLDDPKVFELLRSGDNDWIFYLDNPDIKTALKALEPDCFEDLIFAIAWLRPGPLAAGLVDSYIRRRHGSEPVVYPHPDLEPVLKETYGLIVYQEQVSQILVDLGDMFPGQADQLRKVMFRNRSEGFLGLQKAFISGAQKKSGISRTEAVDLCDWIGRLAMYAFSKSHAVARASIAYQAAYLKAHHTIEFMMARQAGDSGSEE
jgi:DNA polymerase-3 subunit alpha